MLRDGCGPMAGTAAFSGTVAPEAWRSISKRAYKVIGDEEKQKDRREDEKKGWFS